MSLFQAREWWSYEPEADTDHDDAKDVSTSLASVCSGVAVAAFPDATKAEGAGVIITATLGDRNVFLE